MPGFEPWVFSSGGGRTDHYATPPEQRVEFESFLKQSKKCQRTEATSKKIGVFLKKPML
jgi:hypothetical protein